MLVIFMKRVKFLILLIIVSIHILYSDNSLPALKGTIPPQNLEQVWGNYDPRTENLEIEVHKEWKENGVTYQCIRYLIGTFKNKKSYMAAIYAFPTGKTDLPGILQIHGGGGRSNPKICADYAQQGYAILSLNWRADKRYLEDHQLSEKAQTEWGAIDGTQSRGSRTINPTPLKIDQIASGRNSGYFLRTLAARRGLTFLEQQKEVNGDKLGVKGHSMGSVITMQTSAIDSRVKACTPSAGPPIYVYDEELLLKKFRNDRERLRVEKLKIETASPGAYLSKLTCPTLFMNPLNDFHGKIEDMIKLTNGMPLNNFSIASSEHLNHAHFNEAQASEYLWFDAHLKKSFIYPELPTISLVDATSKQSSYIEINPDPNSGLMIEYVDVFYTRDIELSETVTAKNRYWQHVSCSKDHNSYKAFLELLEVDKPLWVMANIKYRLPEKTENYNFPESMEHTREFTVSTKMLPLSYSEVKKAGITLTIDKTNVLSANNPMSKKMWYEAHQRTHTHLFSNPKLEIEDQQKFVFQYKSKGEGSIRFYFNGYGIKVPVQESDGTSLMTFKAEELVNEKKEKLLSWNALKEQRTQFYYKMYGNLEVELEKIYFE